MIVTPRSFFNIVLKIFGLFFLREIVIQIPAIVSQFIAYFSYTEYESIGVLIVSILILLFYCFLVMQLMLKTNQIIDLFKLDKGFQQIEFTFDDTTERKIALSLHEILTISLIVVGGYILVEEIPKLCSQIYIYVQERKSIFYGSSRPSQANLLIPASKIIIGLLILGERKRIVDFFESRDKKTPTTED